MSEMLSRLTAALEVNMRRPSRAQRALEVGLAERPFSSALWLQLSVLEAAFCRTTTATAKMANIPPLLSRRQQIEGQSVPAGSGAATEGVLSVAAAAESSSSLSSSSSSLQARARELSRVISETGVTIPLSLENDAMLSLLPLPKMATTTEMDKVVTALCPLPTTADLSRVARKVSNAMSGMQSVSLELVAVSVLPHVVFAVPGLEELTVVKSILNSLPFGLSHATRLLRLDISFNAFAEVPLAVCCLPSLRFLDISHNAIQVIRLL
jgi:hypothetical protein